MKEITRVQPNFDIRSLMIEIEDQANRDLVISTKHKDDELTLYFSRELTAGEAGYFQGIMDNHDHTLFSEFLVYGLTNPEFGGFPIENIDFKRHLRKDIALTKKVKKIPNGRPEWAKYYWNGDLIAEIEFIFDTSAGNLMTRRREYLYYYRGNGEKSYPILIKDKTYDMSDLHDGNLVVMERVQARESIVSEIKAFLSGVLMQALQQPLDQVVIAIKPFWDSFKLDRDDFIELATTDWRDALLAIDLTTTPYTFLAIPIDQNGTTVRDYIVSRLSY